MCSLSYIHMMQGTSQYNFVIRSYSRKCAILCWNVISREMCFDSWNVNPSTRLHIHTGSDYNTSCWFLQMVTVWQGERLAADPCFEKENTEKEPWSVFPGRVPLYCFRLLVHVLQWLP